MITICIYDKNSFDCVYSYQCLFVSDLKDFLYQKVNKNKPIRDYLFFLKHLSSNGYRVELVFS